MDIDKVINLSVAYAKVFFAKDYEDLVMLPKVFHVDNIILFCHTFPLPEAAIKIEDGKIVEGFVLTERGYVWDGIELTRELFDQLSIKNEII
ncbi:MAG: hypothetical protein ACYDG4_14795 [Desulfuromonadaceae bacterium]